MAQEHRQHFEQDQGNAADGEGTAVDGKERGRDQTQHAHVGSGSLRLESGERPDASNEQDGWECAIEGAEEEFGETPRQAACIEQEGEHA